MILVTLDELAREEQSLGEYIAKKFPEQVILRAFRICPGDRAETPEFDGWGVATTFRNSQLFTFNELRQWSNARTAAAEADKDDWKPGRWLTHLREKWQFFDFQMSQLIRGKSVDIPKFESDLAAVIIALDKYAAAAGLSLAEIVKTEFNRQSDDFGSDLKL